MSFFTRCLTISTIAAISALPIFVAPVAAQTYNATNDYSTVNNPNGVWSAGYKTSLTGTLNLYDVSNNSFAVGSNFWQSSVVQASGVPAFYKSFSSTQFGQIVGAVHLHGGASNEFSFLRFTAPTAGNYSIAAGWFAGDTGETSAHIVRDNTLSLFFDGATSDGANFNGIFSLAAGGFFDVGVGTVGDFSNDTTPFSLTITYTGAVVPEAGTLALLGVVVVPFVMLSRRRRGA